MSALVKALVAVAKAGNLVGVVFADGKVGLSDVGAIISGLGDLSGLAGVDLKGVLTESGNLQESEKASAVVAFKSAFDLPADALEASVELAVDAALTLLVAFDKAKDALGFLKAA